MTLQEFGKIVREIREKELHLQQKEMAEELNVPPTMVSRLEIGQGGRIDFVFQVLEYFKTKGLKSHMIFSDHFQLSNLQRSDLVNIDQIVEIIQDMKKYNDREVEKVIMMLKSLT
jgi:transcriptional regulator with XRE-family HTH domain